MDKKNIFLSILLTLLLVILIGIVLLIISQNRNDDSNQANNTTLKEDDENSSSEDSNNTSDSGDNTESETLSGISLSPKSYEAEDFATFMEKVAESGEVLTSAGNILDLDNESSSAHVVASLGDAYGYTPVVLTHIVNPGNKGLKEPLTPETQEKYLNSISTFLNTYDLKYFGMGVEVDMLYEYSPADYLQFVEFFNKVAELVQSESPNTDLIVVFQLEHIKGLRGGLFGGVNDPNQNNWNLINDFPMADIIGFTTYPGLIYKSPSEIPIDYYSEILSYTDRPVAFLEVGWARSLELPGWESSEAEQIEFIQIFNNQIQALSPRLLVWPFLYNQDETPEIVFKYMGLLNDDQSTSSAYEEWKKL